MWLIPPFFSRKSPNFFSRTLPNPFVKLIVRMSQLLMMWDPRDDGCGGFCQFDALNDGLSTVRVLCASCEMISKEEKPVWKKNRCKKCKRIFTNAELSCQAQSCELNARGVRLLLFSHVRLCERSKSESQSLNFLHP